MSRRKVLQDFIEIIDIGSKVTDAVGEVHKDWKSKSGHIFNFGYSINRRINYDETRVINVTNSILNCQTYNIPLFESRLFENGALMESVLTKNPTTTFRGVLDALHIKVPVKSIKGFRFFGFDSVEYQNKLLDVRTITIDLMANEEATKNVVDVSSNTHSRQCSWNGVVSYGSPLRGNPLFLTKPIDGVRCQLQPGYEAVRMLYLGDRGFYKVKLGIVNENDRPCFVASIDTDPVKRFSSSNANELVKIIFKNLEINVKKKWSGYEFFGFTKPEVLRSLTSDPVKPTPAKEKSADLAEVLKTVENIAHRNAGPTGGLTSRGMAGRNEKIHKLVEYMSSGDVIKYIEYLLTNYSDEVNKAFEGENSYLKQFVRTFKPKFKKELSLNEAAAILAGKLELSQRKYIELRIILQESDVLLPDYKKVSDFVKDIDLGDITKLSTDENTSMGVYTDVQQTLEKVINNKLLYEKFQFLAYDHQLKLKHFLLEKDENLYRSFDPNRKTIFLRETADNFRACAKMPTEQTSFSIMNLTQLLNSPNGQFISTLWRGDETRKNFESNVMASYNSLKSLVENGLELTVNGDLTSYNILVFLVADLSCVKELLGRCSVTHSLGCFYCDLPSEKWDDLPTKFGENRTIQSMHIVGLDAEKVLGKYPDKYSANYKNFTKKSGQYASVLFRCTILDFVPPCGLHLILAHHRYLWKMVHFLAERREQLDIIPTALKKIGCTYLSFQLLCYFKVKNKTYDGSATLKMIGNDAKALEDNIDTFLNCFVLASGDRWDSPRSKKLYQLKTIYEMFRDIAKDIRSTTYCPIRASTFQERVDSFFKKFSCNSITASSAKMPYLHMLRNHVPYFVKLFGELFGWGYGYFSTNAGEHLNKAIKFQEMATNLSDDRFHYVIRKFRLKQLIYSKYLFNKNYEYRCSACGDVGHNKKNKMCPAHLSHPEILFMESDDENE